MTNESILSILAHATPTPTSRSKGQKSKSRGGGILWRPLSRTACWIFKSCKLGTFLHVNSAELELYIKFASNIRDSHWDRRTYAWDLHLMTSRDLLPVSTFGHVVISASPSCISPYNLMQDIFIPSKVIDILPKWRPPPSWIFSLWEFGHSGLLIVWYLCYVPNLV